MTIELNDIKIIGSELSSDNENSIDNLQNLSEDELNVSGGFFFKKFRKFKKFKSRRKSKFSFFKK